MIDFSFVSNYMQKLLVGSSWKFCQRCVCEQGWTG